MVDLGGKGLPSDHEGIAATQTPMVRTLRLSKDYSRVLHPKP